MLEYLRTRKGQGTRTLPVADQEAALPARFRGRLVFDDRRCTGGCAACRAQPPAAPLVRLEADGPRLDLGSSLFAPEEAEACPEGAIRFTTDHRMAVRGREDLGTRRGELQLARELEGESRRLFGRSLRLRSVSAGSCNGCEAELVALGNVVFDLARFGVQFVASPRHADALVLTGSVSLNMRDALYATYDAIPDPRLVIVVGACAISGGPFRGSPQVGNGVPPDLPVDLWIPGCPPHPLTILDGLLRLLGRLPRARGARAPEASA